MTFSRCYDERWVERLYRGFSRNITVPWRFVLFTDRLRNLPNEIKQEILKDKNPSYGTCIEPFRFGVPMILVGLDTIVVGPIDHLAEYCLREKTVALPRDPNHPHQSCNGVCLIPSGHQNIYRNWNGENDMVWLRKQSHVFIDDLFPGQVLSYKCHVKKQGLGDARIVYFHGAEKPHEVDEPWIRDHWLNE